MSIYIFMIRQLELQVWFNPFINQGFVQLQNNPVTITLKLKIVEKYRI